MSRSDQIALLGLAVATLLSLVSLFISLHANRISAGAEELAKAAYFAERRIALTSAVGKDEHGAEYLLLSPSGSDQAINNVTLFFPQKLRIPPIALAAGDLRLFHVGISEQIRAYWDSRTPTKEGFALVRPNVPMPVAVVIHGYTKGDAVITCGIYDLYCRYARLDGTSAHLQILSLTLNNWSLPNADPQDEADRALAAQEAVTSSSNPPIQPTGSAGD